MTVRILRVGAAATAFRADDAALAALAARLPRAQPPHLEDRTSLNAGPPPWQAKYLENRLANLARFTGRQIYVRLLDALPPEPAGQTAQQFADALATKLRLAPGDLLACYFTSTDQWLTSGGPANLTLAAALATAASTEPSGRSSQGRMYATAEAVVSALIDQTDPP
jgi:hypothetical protein